MLYFCVGFGVQPPVHGFVDLFRLHCEELIGKAEEHEGKKYLTVNDYILDK